MDEDRPKEVKSDKAPPMHSRDLSLAMHYICDICGKPRGGRKYNHAKCAKLRQQKGF